VSTQADRPDLSPQESRRPAGGASRARPRTGRRERSTAIPRTAEEARATAGPVEGPRTGAKRTLTGVMREIPNYLRLLFGLMTDRRVERLDKLLVMGAIAYILIPLDWLPDFIPFLGEVDDLFVLMLSLQRLIQNAGRRVLLDHWPGDPSDLSDLNLQRVVAAAAFFLPRRMRRRLRTIGRL
jgi:uncharacterized membrane protein YkvA (DUF1232 family)